jgi:GINS complex subunit 1
MNVNSTARTPSIGELSTQLVTESLKSQQTNLLRPYADALVRSLARETRSLNDQIEAAQQVFSQIEQDEGQICALLISALSLRRNKRALLVYHNQRLDKLKALFWSSGGQVGSILAQDRETRKNMAPSEVDFIRGYAQLAIDYKACFSKTALDLTAPVMGHPPKELYVQVRVLKDIGDVDTEWGTVSFTKDSLVFVRRPDVERLILNGYLQVVS